MSADGDQNNDLSLQIANLLKHGINSQPKSPKLSDNLQINLKLNSQNYGLWTRMIRVAIGGKSKTLLKHLTSNPPDQNDETYQQWEQDDLVVFSWLIQNIEPTLAGNLTEFPTAKLLWDALVVTYSSGRDKLQTFSLHVKSNDIKQNDNSLEDFWITLQGVWGEIDRIDPNPMKCPEDIQTYLKIRSEQKLFQFLNALDQKYDHIKREILRLEPLPIVEAAYAVVRKEAAHQNILGAASNNTNDIAARLIATETEGLGLITKGHRRFEGKKYGPSTKEEKSHLKCTHCGMTKHTKEQCFKLVGYPEWWSDGHKKGIKTTGHEKGKASAALGNKEVVATSDDSQNATGFGGVAASRNEEDLIKTTNFNTFIIESFKNCIKGPGFGGLSFVAQSYNKRREQSWIFDCGATDTMTYELSDFATSTKPTKSYIQTTNGGIMNVKNGGTIEISPTLKLSNCLYVPSLSHKLLSDIRTGAIIGRGTERQGLYYVDEVTQSGTVMLSHGTVEREAWLWYKARLVAKGYTQTYGIDYSETFSPVAKINTIRVLFSIAANKEWPVYQFDVKNAFLHGELKEEVYMEAPHRFTNNFGEKEVCRLKKALYGLKQSPRAWFGRFTLTMKHYGFKQSNSDHTLFLKRRNNLITCLIIYVDDMIITGDDKEEITKLKGNLFAEFEMKDIGRLKYFLGIEVLRSKQGIFMCQKKYVLDLLAEVGMIDCKPADTPMIANQKLYMEEKVELADKERYQRMVGKLIYLSHTRPDIAYAVGVVSQFMHQPHVTHMDVVLRIIRYLKGTASHGVLFKPNGHLETQLYTDADWAGDKGNRRSTSGYFTLVGGNLVTWRSKKQKVVALSNAEAEFRGIQRGITEILWIRKLLTEIGYPPQDTSRIMCDNKAAIQISENPVQHDRTKHIEVDRNFIKEKLETKIISLPFVRSEDQLADILTKVVNERILHKCRQVEFWKSHYST
ncbi:uncharacterized protein LOC143565815 [Bidens hawaiensis]|uniref:uncharacterized protein LOC143565815 n=1 Tax=Bidens hawaiensis TaxID=980011 RepID=UPI00404A791F